MFYSRYYRRTDSRTTWIPYSRDWKPWKRMPECRRTFQPIQCKYRIVIHTFIVQHNCLLLWFHFVLMYMFVFVCMLVFVNVRALFIYLVSFCWEWKRKCFDEYYLETCNLKCYVLQIFIAHRSLIFTQSVEDISIYICV